jgi:hypothetical protein
MLKSPTKCATEPSNRLADAESFLIRFRDQFRPRAARFPVEKFEADLKNTPKGVAKIFFVPNDSDAFALAGIIENALKNDGWAVSKEQLTVEIEAVLLRRENPIGGIYTVGNEDSPPNPFNTKLHLNPGEVPTMMQMWDTGTPLRAVATALMDCGFGFTSEPSNPSMPKGVANIVIMKNVPW